MSQTRQYEMTASGLEWLGDIPVNWIMERAKFNFCQSFDRGNKTPELLAATQKYGMYPQRLLEGVVRVMAGTDLQQFKTVHKNDFVISLRSFQGGFERSDYEGVCSPAYQVFHAHKKYDANWLKWFFKNEMFIDAMNALTVGIREGRNIKYEDFANSEIPVPPLPEQAAIAAYLDEKCAAIDGIIAEAKASIDDYKAWKSSVIFEAVTKGLDPNADMKDSGVEWIGRMPCHWRISRLQSFYRIKKDIAEKTGYTVLSVTQQGVKPKNMNSKGQFALDYSKYQIVKKGDFVMNHMDLLTGGVGISAYDGVTSPDYRVFSSRTECRDLFYKYIFQYCYLNRVFYGLGHGVADVGRWRLPADMFRKFMLPVPPLPEQESIAAYLDEKCAAIDGIIAEKESLIAELETYKKSLIFETVTGKRKII